MSRSKISSPRRANSSRLCCGCGFDILKMWTPHRRFARSATSRRNPALIELLIREMRPRTRLGEAHQVLELHVMV